MGAARYSGGNRRSLSLYGCAGHGLFPKTTRRDRMRSFDLGLGTGGSTPPAREAPRGMAGRVGGEGAGRRRARARAGVGGGGVVFVVFDLFSFLGGPGGYSNDLC